MAWTYNDYRTIDDDELRLARLALHMDEVSAKIDADVSDGEVSVNRSTLLNYLGRLEKAYDKLEARVRRSATGRLHAGKGRPGRVGTADEDC